jgi:hypothetical protein
MALRAPRVKPNANPRLNQGSTLANGLIGAWGFINPGGASTLMRDIGPNRFDGTLGSAAAWEDNIYGPDLRLPNSANGKVTVTFNSILNCTSGITIAIRIKTPPTADANFHCVFGKPFAATHTSPFFDWSVGLPVKAPPTRLNSASAPWFRTLQAPPSRSTPGSG